MATLVTETFFRPNELRRDSTTIPASLYNRCRLLLNRCSTEYLFIPIRSMQFLAVYDEEEILFVDSQAYAVRDGEGGRLIVLSWSMPVHPDRDSLSTPVAIELVHYLETDRELQVRLMSELPKALDRLEEKARDTGCDPRLMKVLPFRR